MFGGNMIIGVGYKARVGKDTIGDYLEDRHGWYRTSFAASLKEATKCIYGWTDEHVYGSLKEVKDPFWDITPREVLQKLGTEAIRTHMREDIWVKSVQRRIAEAPDANWIITDVRFPNEVEAIKSWNGFAVKVSRSFPDAISTSGHISERILDDYKRWDDTIENNGSFENLFMAVDKMVERLSLNKLASEIILEPW
jgi:hypothetical protein